MRNIDKAIKKFVVGVGVLRDTDYGYSKLDEEKICPDLVASSPLSQA